MNTIITKSRPAFLNDAEIGTTVRFTAARTEATGHGERIVRDEDTLQPVYDEIHGAITTYQLVHQTRRPYVAFNVAGHDRLFKFLPDYPIEIDQEVDNSITAQISRVTEAAHRVRSGTIADTDAATALLDAAELLKAIQLRAYPMGDHADETLEQVVVTIHGVDISIRGRQHDLFIHVDDERDPDEKQAQPLCVEVNDCGEMDYGTPND